MISAITFAYLHKIITKFPLEVPKLIQEIFNKFSVADKKTLESHIQLFSPDIRVDSLKNLLETSKGIVLFFYLLLGVH